MIVNILWGCIMKIRDETNDIRNAIVSIAKSLKRISQIMTKYEMDKLKPWLRK
jgi:hypothetical protein